MHTAFARDEEKPQLAAVVHAAENDAHAPPTPTSLHTFARPFAFENVVHSVALPAHEVPPHVETQSLVSSQLVDAAPQPSRQLRTQAVPHVYLPCTQLHVFVAALHVAPDAASQVPHASVRGWPQRSVTATVPHVLPTAVQALATSVASLSPVHSHAFVAALHATPASLPHTPQEIVRAAPHLSVTASAPQTLPPVHEAVMS